MKLIKKITPIEENFSKWFVDVVKNGNLIEYGPVKGTIIFKPNAYGIWENIQFEFNKILKSTGVKNVYLPMLIPSSLIKKEKNHLDGFTPELATITKVGSKELSEYIYIRPTSEVLFAKLFKSEINSYNDLPILYNQWSNVLRWEKTTNPFLRTIEFLWQEGHTSHVSEKEAIEKTWQMINIYKKFINEYLAIPVILGIKTEREKFAGAISTYTIEAMMKDGKALQSATSHYLGQNFSKMFDVTFKNNENEFIHVFQTSWGLSTRIIGALIMSHGDNRGIIVPPKIAPIQVDLIEILANQNNNVSIIAKKIEKILNQNNYRCRLDNSLKTFGYKVSQSEIEGIPVRIEIGPRDLINNQVLVVRRDTLKKKSVHVDEVLNVLKIILNEIQDNLFNVANKRLQDNIIYTNDYEEFKYHIEKQKFVLVPLVDDLLLEKKIKDETTATARCIPLEFETPKEDKCIFTKIKTTRFVIFAKAY